MRRFLTALIIFGSLAMVANAQQSGESWFNLDISELPATCLVGREYEIKDGATASDCSVGGGSHLHSCVCQADGSSYKAEIAVAAAVRLEINQTTHGFSAGQWVMHDDATNAWELLDSTAIDINNNAIGLVFSVTDANNFTLSVGGPESWTHAFDVGPLYASSTPGTLTDTVPALGTVEWLVAVASSSGIVIIMQREWIQL
jgi:hypothetical protein